MQRYLFGRTSPAEVTMTNVKMLSIDRRPIRDFESGLTSLTSETHGGGVAQRPM